VMNRQEAEQITGQADPSPINEPYNWKRLGRGRDCQDGWPWSGGDDRLRRVRHPSLSYVHTSGKIGSVDVFSATFAALWGWADKKLTECLRREFLTDYVAWPLPFTLGKCNLIYFATSRPCSFCNRVTHRVLCLVFGRLGLGKRAETQ